MKFDHIYKYKGVYYPTGADVPIEEDNQGVSEMDTPVILEEQKPELQKYTKEDLDGMTVKEIKAIANKLGITIKTISPKSTVIEEFLSLQ